MDHATILVVDDDRDILEIISLYLTNAGYNVHTADTSKKALKKITENSYDLFIFDVMLPDLEGTHLCEIVREKLLCPIIFISCMHGQNHILKAFAAGGDDYITKPFNPAELIARVKANLRRVSYNKKSHRSAEITNIGSLIIDRKKNSVFKNNEEIHLTPLEFDILSLMVDNVDTVLSYADIYKNVWGNDSVGDTRSVMVHVSNLRKKLECRSNEKYIVTVKRRGYKFCC